MLTKDDILTGLRALGIKPGMSLMVHSSLKSFGPVDGGAPTVIKALQQTVSPGGTMMMPSFNHASLFMEGGPGYYDPQTSPTTNGAIPNAFWQMDGVARTLNPTHAFACWGRDAARYVENHHQTLTIGPESPLGKLCADGGYGLLLGVDYTANTLHHLAEYLVKAPCLGYRTRSYPVRLPGGRLVDGRSWNFRADPCPINDGAAYAAEMQARGLEQVAVIGRCRATFFRLSDCLEVVNEHLLNGLGQHPPCRRCPIRTGVGVPTVPSDWDEQANCLKPDSTAWDY